MRFRSRRRHKRPVGRSRRRYSSSRRKSGTRIKRYGATRGGVRL